MSTSELRYELTTSSSSSSHSLATPSRSGAGIGLRRQVLRTPSGTRITKDSRALPLDKSHMCYLQSSLPLLRRESVVASRAEELQSLVEASQLLPEARIERSFAAFRDERQSFVDAPAVFSHEVHTCARNAPAAPLRAWRPRRVAILSHLERMHEDRHSSAQSFVNEIDDLLDDETGRRIVESIEVFVVGIVIIRLHIKEHVVFFVAPVKGLRRTRGTASGRPTYQVLDAVLRPEIWKLQASAIYDVFDLRASQIDYLQGTKGSPCCIG